MADNKPEHLIFNRYRFVGEDSGCAIGGRGVKERHAVLCKVEASETVGVRRGPIPGGALLSLSEPRRELQVRFDNLFLRASKVEKVGEERLETFARNLGS